MTSVYFGPLKGKILRKRVPKTIKDISGLNAPFVDGAEAFVIFDEGDRHRWLPLSKLSIRIEKDVDGTHIPDKFLVPLLHEDLEKFQTIAFKNRQFGVYLDSDGDILHMQDHMGTFYESITNATGIIMNGNMMVNEKLLRKTERFS